MTTRKQPVQKKVSGAKQASVSKKMLKGGVDPSIGKPTQWKPGESGNPAGKPKGAMSLSKRIQQMMDDEDFTTYLPDTRDGWKEFKGAPAIAIINTALIKAVQGDEKSREWLAKYGYGNKIELTGEDGAALMPIALDAAILNRLYGVGSTPSIPTTNSQ